MSVLGGVFLAACSSSGGDEPADGVADTGTATVDSGRADTGASTTDSGPADATLPADAGRPDAATDAATDAGPDATADATVPADAADAGSRPDAADAGSVADAADAATNACVSANTPVTQSCGICGRQTASCTATDAGLVQGAFGTCSGELDGGCLPGYEVDGGIPCGRCGRARAVCQSDCVFAQGSCIEPPTSVCTPGERTFRLGMSCTNPNEGRYAVCTSNCSYTYSECTLEETWLSVSSTTGATVSRPFSLTATKTIARGGTTASGGVCAASSTVAPYQTTVIRNTTGKALKIAVWESFAPNGPSSLDTVLNVFRGEGLPADRSGCLGASDSCSSSPCVGNGLGGLVGTSAVSIGVGETLTAFTSCYSSSCTVPANLVINARTLEILP